MSNKIKLPLDLKLVKAFKNRDLDQISQHDKDESLRDFIKLFQKLKEFRELSEMSLKQIYYKSELIEIANGETYQIEDDHKLDFFYLVKGECSLEFEVTRTYESSSEAANKVFKELSPEEIASQNDVKLVQQLSKRLSKLLVQPYFQTEVIEEVANSAVA